jgi:hypothetical protein
MTGNRAADLFQEYADAFARGEVPRARDYLDRADEEDRDRLAGLLDRFMASTPVRAAALDDLGLVEAWTTGESPLVALRVRRGLKRETIVESLHKTFALPETALPALKERYHELEAGLLDPDRLSSRLVLTLSSLLGVREDTIRTLRPRRIEASPAFRAVDAVPESVPTVNPERHSDVDALFLSDE